MNADESWPEITFKVFTASGRYVGYASSGPSDCGVYPPGGEDEDWFGLIQRECVEFGSGVQCGRIEGTSLYYFPEGELAATLHGDTVLDENSNLIATIVGEGSKEERLGAVMLLILCRWYLAGGLPNPDVR